MKKTILIGALATAFIVTGGTGLYMASAKEIPSINKISPQMSNMMETGNRWGPEISMRWNNKWKKTELTFMKCNSIWKKEI